MSADSLKLNGYNVWHDTLGGDMRSNAGISFRNLTASAYVDIAAKNIYTSGGFWAGDGGIRSDSTITMLNAAGTDYQPLVARVTYLPQTTSASVAAVSGLGALFWDGTRLLLKTSGGLYQITTTPTT